MNIVIDEAAEVYVKDAKPRRDLGMEIRSLVQLVLTPFRTNHAQRRQHHTNPASRIILSQVLCARCFF